MKHLLTLVTSALIVGALYVANIWYPGLRADLPWLIALVLVLAGLPRISTVIFPGGITIKLRPEVEQAEAGTAPRSRKAVVRRPSRLPNGSAQGKALEQETDD